MKCIFCKENSSSSKSKEHIIPESLGNMDHVLSQGIVCDSCNNYFSIKIEKPLLDSGFISQLRFRQTIPNKRGTPPHLYGFFLQGRKSVKVFRAQDGLSISSYKENEETELLRTLSTHPKGTLLIPQVEDFDECLFSKFLGKIALEVLAQRVSCIDGGLQEIVEKSELDELRKYVRFGGPPRQWLFHQRRIYREDSLFVDPEPYEVLHEYMLLYTPQKELYLILALGGVEYALNLGRSSIEGYLKWLTENRNRSPLYS
jgi:hypothetical protein